MNTTPSASSIKFCPSCGTELGSNARFCGQCGVNIMQFRRTAPVTTGTKVAVAVTGALFFAAVWMAQDNLVGKVPVEQFKGEKKAAQTAATEDAPLDADLQALKQAAEKNPRDKKGWFDYAQALGERLSMKDAPRNLIFEAIGALRQVLDIDPQDKDALLTMAEISFQQQAFAKSAEFYEKYLALAPEDIDMRARYASSLSFVGKFDQALTELNRVLTVKPDHFHGLAYSAVTYAEMGNKEKAREVGTKALSLAPSEEAKKRFENFLASLDRKQPKEPEHTHDHEGHDHEHAAPAAAAASGELNGAAAAVTEYIRSNPVAGKKFVGATMDSPETLRISLDNFPMSQMPPFVKDKFTSAIRERAFASGSPLATVILYDSTAQQELERLTR